MTKLGCLGYVTHFIHNSLRAFSHRKYWNKEKRNFYFACTCLTVLHPYHAGVDHVYLHVVNDAEAAFKMYNSLGYAEVARETEQQATMRCRPAVHLLHKDLSGRSKRMAEER